MGEVTLQDVADRVDDVARALARQAVTLGAFSALAIAPCSR